MQFDRKPHLLRSLVRHVNSIHFTFVQQVELSCQSLNVLDQRISKYGPRTSNISITGEIVRNANSKPHPKLIESKL